MIAVLVLAGTWATRSRASARPGPAPIAGRGAVSELIRAVPFTLREGYVHTWRREQPMVNAGYLCVFAVDPAFVQPRQTAEPVLYVGDQTAERVNHGVESGRVIAIVPCAVGQELDFERTPVWFGEPALPEQADAASIRAARVLHERTRTRMFSQGEVRAALARGGETLELSTRVDLEHHAGLWVLDHSPAEFELGDALLRSGQR
jgi:hypothetical protein